MNTLQKQFSDALKREKKFVTTYYTNETVPCLFRKLDDKKNTTNHIEILYDVNSPIKQGQIITYGGKHFITLNQETVENNVYYKSSLIECNVTVPLVSNSIIQNIPCYAGDLYSTILTNGTVFDLVDGKVDLITESTDFVNNVEFDSVSQFMGGYYKLKNKANKTGIAYLYFERTQAPKHTYDLELISNETTFEIDTTTELNVIAKVDGLIDSTATIVFTSSDDSLATVDSMGVITFKAEGMVTIIAIWLEQNIQKSIELTITEDVAPESYTVEITSSNISGDTIYMGYKYNFTGKVKDSLGNIVSPVDLVFSIDNDYNGKVVFTDNGNGTCTIMVDDSAWDLIAKQFTLTCIDMISGSSATWKLTISL